MLALLQELGLVTHTFTFTQTHLYTSNTNKKRKKTVTINVWLLMSFHSLVIFWLNQRQLCNFIFFLIKPGVVQVSGWPQVLSFLVYTQSVFWSFNREAFSPLNFDGSCPAGGSTSESSTLSVHLQVPADITLLLLQSANRFISLSLLSLRKCGNKCNCTGKKEQIFFFFCQNGRVPIQKYREKRAQ